MTSIATEIARIKAANVPLNAFVEFAATAELNSPAQISASFPRRRESKSVDVPLANDHLDSRLRGNDGVEQLVPEATASKDGQFQAKMPESALQHWTFAIKSNIAVVGLAHTAGIGAYRNRVAKADAFCVARLRDAGAAILGTVNMEEAALGAVTNNPHFGKTHNPHRADYTAGGSSGGSAAAVAAGLVRAALGTDTMGSCRIPAAYCGVVGFKPSFGRISTGGVEPLSRRLDHVGILANNVADVRACFEVLDVFDANDAWAVNYDLTKLHVASKRLAVLDAASRHGLDDNVRAAYERALAQLRGAGFELIARPLDQAALATARRAGLLICEAELANSLAPFLAGDDPGVSPFLKKMIAFGAAKSAPHLAMAHASVDAAVLVLRQQLDGVDALCWPTAPQSAFSFNAPAPANQADFTCLANFTGAPAISLPLRVAGTEMPIGLQIVAARGEDVVMLDVAAEIEKTLSSRP